MLKSSQKEVYKIMELENVKIKDLHPYDRNAKKHPKEQIDRIVNSIREFGFQH
jgi:ParB-like chromosome segregation protein Spo0J